MTAHFYDDGGKKHDFILDLVKMAASHTGENIAAALELVCTRFGLKKRVCR